MVINENKHAADNHRATMASIAGLILSDPMATFIGRHLDAHRLDRLEAMAQGGDEVRYIEFNDAGTSITLEIDVRVMKTFNDADGNEWHENGVRCSVNWSAHGSIDCSRAQAMFNLYAEVAALGARISRTYSKTYKFNRTAAELVAIEANRKRYVTEEAARNVVRRHRKGLRCGGQRSLDRAITTDIARGQYAVIVDEPTGNMLPGGVPQVKEYVLTVDENCSYIVRTA